MYIKKFYESIDLDSGYEYCKDIAETISEYDDGFEYIYRFGFYGSSFLNDASSENDKKAIYICIGKKDSNKFTFEDSMNILKKGKIIYDRVKNHCDDVNFEVRNSNGFYLYLYILFENENTELKKDLKINRIRGILRRYFSDYSTNKRIYIMPEHKKEYPFLKDIDYTYIKFTENIDFNDNRANLDGFDIKIKNLRILDKSDKWVPIPNKTILPNITDYILDKMLENLKKDYKISSEIRSGNILSIKKVNNYIQVKLF